jgi:hypothetical protein
VNDEFVTCGGTKSSFALAEAMSPNEQLTPEDDRRRSDRRYSLPSMMLFCAAQRRRVSGANRLSPP